VPRHKNHHIVPQHYLKGFSKDRDDKSIKTGDKIICRYNIKEPVKPYAAIKKTCAGSYFYGTEHFYGRKEDLEELLKSFEDNQAPVLDKLIIHQTVDCLTPEDRVYLYTFTMMQYARTESAREFAVEKEESVCREVYQKLLDENGYEGVKAQVIVDPVKAQFDMMKTYMMNSMAIRDLSRVLLINESTRHFITSDNPVVFYNYKMINNRCVNGSICSGLMIFCPLTENLLLLFIDKELYDLRKDTPTTIRIKKETDIDSINKLQLFNCYEEIYCHDDSGLEYIKELHVSFKDHESNQIGICYRIKLSFCRLNNENNRKYKRIVKEHKRDNNPYPVARAELSSYRK
jgi:hypothetical protein